MYFCGSNATVFYKFQLTLPMEETYLDHSVLVTPVNSPPHLRPQSIIRLGETQAVLEVDQLAEETGVHQREGRVDRREVAPRVRLHLYERLDVDRLPLLAAQFPQSVLSDANVLESVQLDDVASLLVHDTAAPTETLVVLEVPHLLGVPEQSHELLLGAVVGEEVEVKGVLRQSEVHVEADGLHDLHVQLAGAEEIASAHDPLRNDIPAPHLASEVDVESQRPQRVKLHAVDALQRRTSSLQWERTREWAAEGLDPAETERHGEEESHLEGHHRSQRTARRNLELQSLIGEGEGKWGRLQASSGRK